jgi:UDP-N-acetylglucosamine 2-epimerase
VALEAIVLKKPVVVVNLFKRPVLIPYVERGVAIGAYNADDIEGALKKALHDNDLKKKMDSARQSFINDFVSKIDGKAGERIMELI